jgi:YbgC/YbaW family acyl-CoA thioester hydrolase
MREVFRTTRRVEFADTDMAGIVHFAQFFRFMEGAEHDFLRAHGLSVVMDWEGNHLSFPRVAASCDFRKPARFDDVIEIEVSLDRVGDKSITYRFTFRRGDEVLATGQMSCVCCRVAARDQRIESVEIPAGIRARLLEDAASHG